jgi:hypothetical protein
MRYSKYSSPRTRFIVTTITIDTSYPLNTNASTYPATARLWNTPAKIRSSEKKTIRNE